MRDALMLAAVVSGCLGQGALADKVTLTFDNITGTSSDLSQQLKCVVSSVDGYANKADFTFTNLVGTYSSVTGIYFDGGIITTSALNQFGTVFGKNSTPGDLPGGGSFYANQSFSASALGGPVTGIDATLDYVTIRFDLKKNKTFANLVEALLMDPSLDGSLRVGLHVKFIGMTGSDSYVNNFMVPLPAQVWAGLGTLGVLAGAGYLRRRWPARVG